MLKLKRIDLLIKNDKIHNNCSETDVVTSYKSIRNLSAYVEKRGRVGMSGRLQFGGELGWVVGYSLGGKVGIGGWL
jgi:hypothetical protein